MEVESYSSRYIDASIGISLESSPIIGIKGWTERKKGGLAVNAKEGWDEQGRVVNRIVAANLVLSNDPNQKWRRTNERKAPEGALTWQSPNRKQRSRNGHLNIGFSPPDQIPQILDHMLSKIRLSLAHSPIIAQAPLSSHYLPRTTPPTCSPSHRPARLSRCSPPSPPAHSG